MPKQNDLPLLNGLQATFASAGQRLLQTVELVITTHVPKRSLLAEDIGIKEQHLSDALHGNGKHFAAQWLPAVARYDREHRIAQVVAGWHGLKVMEQAPLTDAEYRLRMEAALRRAGAAGEAIRREALEEEP